MKQNSKAIIDECDKVIKQANEAVEYSAAASGHKFKSVVTEKGISLIVDGVELLKDATAEEAQLFQRAVGLAAHKLNVNNKVREEAQKKRTEKFIYKNGKKRFLSAHEDPDKPDYWREQKSPTAPVKVTIRQGEEVTVTRRTRLSTSLIDTLVGRQEDAYNGILIGFEKITGKVGCKIGSMEPRIVTTGNDRGNNVAEERYWEWAVKAQESGISVTALLDAIYFFKSFRQIDRERQKRKGWARDNVIEGLDLYCMLRGWATK